MHPGGAGPLSSDPHQALRQLWDIADDVDPVCRQNPELFFENQPGRVREAQRHCAVCPMREPCAEYAVIADERFGTWGGNHSPDGAVTD